MSSSTRDGPCTRRQEPAHQLDAPAAQPAAVDASSLLGVVDAAARGMPVIIGAPASGAAGFIAVVDQSERADVAAALAHAGATPNGNRWALFHDLSAEYVDLLTPSDLGVPAVEFDRVRMASTRVAGAVRCRRPELPDELLIRSAYLAPPLRVPSVVQRDALRRQLLKRSSAWVEAAARADEWQTGVALRVLRRSYEAGALPGAGELARLQREQRRAGRPVAHVRSCGAVTVAFSGIDGSGKSTQVYALAAALTALGYDVGIEWSRITHVRGLPVLERWARRALEIVHGSSSSGEAVARSTVTATRELRERHAVVSRLWAGLLTLENAREHRQRIRRGLPAPDVVIRDRYVLDSVVHLRTTYGVRHDVRTHERVVAALSPPVQAAFYLDLPAEVAFARKRDFGLPQLQTQRAAYLDANASLGVVRLDATEPRDVLAARVGRQVWRLLAP